MYLSRIKKKRNVTAQLCCVSLSKTKVVDVASNKALKLLLKELTVLTSTALPSYAGVLLNQGEGNINFSPLFPANSLACTHFSN